MPTQGAYRSLDELQVTSGSFQLALTELKPLPVDTQPDQLPPSSLNVPPTIGRAWAVWVACWGAKPADAVAAAGTAPASRVAAPAAANARRRARIVEDLRMQGWGRMAPPVHRL